MFNSVKGLCRHQDVANFEVAVFGGSDQFSLEDNGDWAPVRVRTASVFGPTSFGYQPKLRGMIEAFSPDVIHVHGLWTYCSLVGLRFARQDQPVVVSPRGMLDPWALQQLAYKKKIGLKLFERAHLDTAAHIHVLCQEELTAIRELGIHTPATIIPNGVQLPDLAALRPSPKWAQKFEPETKTLLFLGRLHQKKGIENLVQGLSQIHSEFQKAGWKLIIAGWGDPIYERELKKIITDLNLEDLVEFVGPQFGAEKEAALSHADAFILPSYSEGLPMAVLEAWSYGKPVLMTKYCNLTVGFDKNAAIKIEPNAAHIATQIGRLITLHASELKQMGVNGRDLVAQQFTWSKVADHMNVIYNKIYR